MYTDFLRRLFLSALSRRLTGRTGAMCAVAVAAVMLAATVSPAQAQQRIIGGTTVADGKYPWVVALIRSRSSGLFNGQFCGGSLIAPRWVMTAAHCVAAQDNPNSPENPQTIDVVVNQSDLGTSLTGERIGAQRIFLHPDYYGAGTPDIALVYLESAASVAPVDLVYPESALETPGVLARVVGWGITSWSFTQEGFPSPRMREVDLPLATPRTCDRAYANSIDDTFLLCAGYANGGRDACLGDSGGPLFVFDQDLQGYSQAGIVSFGRGCALADTPGVYTRVSSQASWIQSTIRSIEPNTVPGSGRNVLTAKFKMDCDGLTCTFDASNSKPGPSPIASYLWQLGNGSSLTGSKITVSYAVVGYKDVQLTVSDAYGNRSTKTRWAKPYVNQTSRRRVFYPVNAQANEKFFFPSSRGQWVNTGTLSGRLTTSESASLIFKLQFWSPSTRTWKVVDQANEPSAFRKIKRADKPGIYRWKIKAGPGGGEYNLTTFTP